MSSPSCPSDLHDVTDVKAESLTDPNVGKIGSTTVVGEANMHYKHYISTLISYTCAEELL